MRQHLRPRIAIPLPTSTNAGYNERCWQQYARAVEESGGVAVPVTLTARPAEVASSAASCAGILLPGSPADIEPEKYGAERDPSVAPSDPAREAVDELLLQDAFNLHKPLLGICYGHQSLNVWRGGSLIPDLRGAVRHDAGGSVAEAHLVRLAEIAGVVASTTETLQEREFPVNSSHHQAVARVGDGLTVTAICPPDGVIEAVEMAESDKGFVVGVQWHPERTFAADRHSRLLFARFIDAARLWAAGSRSR